MTERRTMYRQVLGEDEASNLGVIVRAGLSKSYLVIVWLLVIAIGSQLSPAFLTAHNAINVITFAAVTSVLAIGQFFVIVTGGIDLSVGSLVALSTVIVALALRAGQPWPVATLYALVICGVAGLINGGLIVFLGLAPFIATLAMLSIAVGTSYIIQSTNLIAINNNAFGNFFYNASVFGVIPSPIVIFLLVMGGAWFVCRYTAFGRQIYAIGGNPESARLSGLPVRRDLILVYVISGVLAGLAGVLASAQLLEGSSLIGQNYELDAIAAVVVGGASLFGGKGGPVAAVVGGLIIETLTNIMNLMGISSQPQLVIKGIVIVVAVFFAGGGLSKVHLRRRPGKPYDGRSHPADQEEVAARRESSLS